MLKNYKMTQYRIEWIIIHNNHKGVGHWHHSKVVIEAWVKYLNEKYSGEIQHYIGAE